MNFIKRKIPSKKITVIDIGSYKVRVAICKIQNSEIELIGYGQKRQDSNNITAQEIVNIEKICDDIKIAIKKAEKQAGIKVKDIIINTPFEDVFFSNKKINSIRKYPKNEINKKELQEIVKEIEGLAIHTYFSKLKKNTPYKQSDLKLIVSNISKILIDTKQTKELIGKNGTNITMFLNNIFIPNDKFEMLNYIGTSIKKNIIKIIPSELSLPHIYNKQKNIVIIDLGNHHTSIIIKKNNNIKGIQKINFGINDLIKIISKNYNKTKENIIKNINDDIYTKEQEEFLAILLEGIIIAIEEILKQHTCPNNFALIGGGANDFVKTYFSQINLHKKGLKIIGNIHLIESDPILKPIGKTILGPNIISMILSAKHLIQQQKRDPIIESLNLTIEDMGL